MIIYKMETLTLLDNHYIRGAFSGMFGIILSQPVDALKTHNQIETMNKFKYSVRTLYKGVSSPLIGVGIEKAIVFGTYNYLQKNGYHTAVSGGLSGLVASLVVTPYERIKILQQTNQKINFNPITLYRGISATFTREIPGFAIYFTTYEKLKNHFYKSKGNEITLLSSFIFGGISGSIAWMFIYPQDKIKTMIQSNASANITSLIKTIYKNGGIRHFYSGFSFAIARAILLHSGTFSMMEFLSK
jgi:solute carrier family 25 carnitine/acylcarnitine transporter 20/29